MEPSVLENQIAWHIKAYCLPPPETEYRFHKVRLWRFDFAWPSRKIALEIEGGTWNGGRHVTGAGYAKDCEKYNEATISGWKVIRATADMVSNGQAIQIIKRAIDTFPETEKVEQRTVPILTSATIRMPSTKAKWLQKALKKEKVRANR